MLGRATCVGLLVALAGCTDNVLLYDVLDASVLVPDANSQREDRPPWSGPDPCGQRNKSARFNPQWQELMIVLDRSSTMQAGFSGSSSRQTAVQNALNDTIGVFQGRVRFGLELFPGDANGKPGGCSHNSCCAGEPSVYPVSYAQNAIGGYLLCSDQQGCESGAADSPSHRALEQVRDYYNRTRPGSGDTIQQSAYVLLITASEPSCNSDPGGTDSCAARTPATNLVNLDIPVVVMTVGYDPRSNPSSCLVQISSLGSSSSMPENTPKLNTPSSYNNLRDTLFGLFRAVARRTCTFNTNDVIPEFATPAVMMGSTTVQKDDSDGWSYDGTNRSQIKLSGWACDQYLYSPQVATITVSYTCSTCDGPDACR